MRAGLMGVVFAVAGCGADVVDDEVRYVPVPWTGPAELVDDQAPDDDDASDDDASDDDASDDDASDDDASAPDPVEPVEPDPVEPPAPADPDGWSEGWSSVEDEMLVLVNEMRAAGGDCPSGRYGPRSPLVMNAELRTAARLHSKDMADNDYFSHDSPNGDSPWDRIGAAGYTAQPVGENIAAGNSSAAATFSQWVGSDGHCRNMMAQNTTEIGIGYANGNASYGHYWTQTFGSR